MREELLHAGPGFFHGIFLFRVLVEFIKVFQVVLDHFIHGAVPGETALCIAVVAVVLVATSVRFFSEGGVVYGPAAALAELLLHLHVCLWGVF